MQVNMQSLKIFLTVVETGSLSAAARELYMSQPSVSAHVRQLETSLSARLLDRGPSGAATTAAGEVLAARARDVLELLDALDDDVAEAQGRADQRLALGGTSTLGNYLLPRVLSRFQESHSLVPGRGVRAELRVGNAEQVTAWVLAGEVSVALMAGEVSHEALVCRPIFDEAMVLVSAPTHRLAGRVASPEDLASERFILREVGSATRQQQEEALEAWNLAQAPAWTVWGSEAAGEAVRSGLGLALVSEHVVARDLRSGDLARIRIQPAPARRPVTLVTMALGRLTPVEEQFVHLLTNTTSWPVG
ncbi:MAG: LysR family transcriptional regulator [Arthrobacter sp.]|jgi:molybdate transport repressor ModE-like protein|nr:LysR family transcriptional regulator [Arthrobacter sp.]